MRHFVGKVTFGPYFYRGIPNVFRQAARWAKTRASDWYHTNPGDGRLIRAIDVRKISKNHRKANPNLWSIAYHSVMSWSLSENELYKLATDADERNRQLDISGVLLVGDKCFFQLLEGPHPNIRYVYSRILLDTRHTSVFTLVNAQIARREFAGWAMRLITTDDLSIEESRVVSAVLATLAYRNGDADRMDTTALNACLAAIARGVYRKPL